jgi:hypothetical protein
MELNIDTLKLYYAEDIKYYARQKLLTPSQIEDLKKKTKFLFQLSDNVDVEQYIRYWGPEQFVIKVENEVDRICDKFFEAMEAL